MKSLCVSLMLAVLLPSSAVAATIYHLEGSKWAIVCDNGDSFTFNGSATGATDVAGLMCPGGGIAAPGVQIWARFGTLQQGDSLLFQRPAGGWQLTADAAATTAQGFRGYPPHGYPCLGCAPCPGNPTEFCSTTYMMQMHPRAGLAGFTMSSQGRVTQQRENRGAAPAVISASRLEGNRWAIVCEGGTAYSFSGSEADVAEVAPVLCPVRAAPRVGAQRGGSGFTLRWMQPAEQFVVANPRTGRLQRR